MPLAARAETGSLSVDSDPILKEGRNGLVKKRNIRAVHSLRLFTCLQIHRTKLVFLVRDTRSRIRGPAAMIFSWLRDFVVFVNFLHVL